MRYVLVVCLLSFLGLHAMELESLLEENTLRRDEIVYDTRRALVNHMSSQLAVVRNGVSQSHGIVIPQDVLKEIYTKMIDVMFEGDEDFEKSFCSKPAAEAFQLYEMLRKKIDPSKPLAPLYKMDQEKRDIVLSKLDPWYGTYVNPIVSIKEQQVIHENSDMQQYLSGKEVTTYPDSINYFSDNEARCMMGSLGCLGIIIGGVGGSVVGCFKGFSYICLPQSVAFCLGLSGLPGFMGCFVVTCASSCKFCDESQKITL
jgi:hypothetical protein